MSSGVTSGTIDRMGSDAYGEMIRRRRIAAGLSQQWLAEQAGTNRPHLSQIERGKIGTPQEPLRSALTAALDKAERECGIPVEHVMEGLGGTLAFDGEVNLGTGEEADPWLRIVYDEARSLSWAGRRALAAHVRAIKEMEASYRAETVRDAAARLVADGIFLEDSEEERERIAIRIKRLAEEGVADTDEQAKEG